jgi:HlyD family secretion protein
VSRRAAAVPLVAALLLLTGCGGADTAPPPTVRVDRGPVITAISASGSIVAVNEQKLGFADGGKVTELLVRVGDRVDPGKVLARLDDRALRDTLAQRQATLNERRAVLGRVRSDRTEAGAAASLAQAREIEDATEDQVEATNDANSAATEGARDQLRVEQSARELAESQLRTARAACPAGSATPCDTSSAEAAVQQADSAVVAARTRVEAAEQQERTGAAAGQVSLENARQGVIAAQNDRNSASADAPFNVSEQQALVADAEAGVAAARRDVDETVLTAPVAGVVAAINGAPGEFIPAPTGVTSQAPGGAAPIPGIAGASETAELPGAGTFVVLAAADAFELVVPFEESDAARLVVGQPADITVDALPDDVLPGRVLAVAPTGQDLGGIVSFYATLSIERPSDRLRSGQTAEAAVRTQVAENVLRVPSAAVGRTDGQPSVRIAGPDGEPETRVFEPGLVGDEYTEVRSGLPLGQDVQLPQATVSATPDPQGGPGG